MTEETAPYGSGPRKDAPAPVKRVRTHHLREADGGRLVGDGSEVSNWHELIQPSGSDTAAVPTPTACRARTCARDDRHGRRRHTIDRADGDTAPGGRVAISGRRRSSAPRGPT